MFSFWHTDINYIHLYNAVNQKVVIYQVVMSCIISIYFAIPRGKVVVALRRTIENNSKEPPPPHRDSRSQK